MSLIHPSLVSTRENFPFSSLTRLPPWVPMYAAPGPLVRATAGGSGAGRDPSAFRLVASTWSDAAVPLVETPGRPRPGSSGSDSPALLLQHPDAVSRALTMRGPHRSQRFMTRSPTVCCSMSRSTERVACRRKSITHRRFDVAQPGGKPIRPTAHSLLFIKHHTNQPARSFPLAPDRLFRWLPAVDTRTFETLRATRSGASPSQAAVAPRRRLGHRLTPSGTDAFVAKLGP